MECRAGEGVEARENGKEVRIFSLMFISKSTPSGPQAPYNAKYEWLNPKKKKKKKHPHTQHKQTYNNGGSIKSTTNS